MATLRIRSIFGLLLVTPLLLTFNLNLPLLLSQELRVIQKNASTQPPNPRPILELQPVVTVTTVEDIDNGACTPTDCSLRMAINSVAEGGTINIAVKGTLQITQPDAFLIDKSMTINGPGPKSTDFIIKQYEQVQYHGSSFVFMVAGYLRKITFKINNLTIEGGEKTQGVAIDNAQGTVVVDRVTFRHISSALAVIANLNGTMSISNSLFSENPAPSSDNARTIADVVLSSGELDIRNSTFYNNFVRQGTIATSGKGTLANITVVNGQTNAQPLIWNVGELEIHNALLVATDPIDKMCWGSYAGGNNFLWPAAKSDEFQCPEKASAIDPKLGKLADNGGATETISLLAGSPAIGAGDTAFCPKTDQRGAALARGAKCDIGAFQTSATLAIQTSGFISGGLAVE